MEYLDLIRKPGVDENKEVERLYFKLNKLIDALDERELPEEFIRAVNREIEDINAFSGPNRGLIRLMRRIESNILQMAEKHFGLVPKNYYQNKWLALGLAVFGIPLGVILGMTLGNMAFIGVGLPLGMVFGMAVGSSMDKKAAAEGKQLDLG